MLIMHLRDYEIVAICSYWPLLLRSDAIKDRGVRRPVVAIILVLPLLSLLIPIAGVVTPLGLYESNEPKSEAVMADFARNNCYFPCPYTSDVIIIVEDGLSRNCTFVGGINATVPDILHNIYTSGMQYERTTMSNYFDIEIFRRLETIALIDDMRAIEGLVVNGKNGGIGFRNHTLLSGYPRGVTWTEDLLFWEPDVECVDINTTFDFEVMTRSQTTSGLSVSKLRLIDRGGFINLNTTDPLDDQRNNPQKNNKPFEWINSEIGKHFRILRGDESYFTLGFIDDFSYYLRVLAIISDTDGLYENPYNITSDSFDAGTLPDALTKLNNTFVLCNLIRGSSPLYACALAIKAIVKTVTFFHNGTDAAINNLVVKEIKDKDYRLLHSAYETFRNISTIRAPSLYFLGTTMNGWILEVLDPQFTCMNLPASITDLTASTVVRTKGVLGQMNAQPDEAVDISVIPLVHKSNLGKLNYCLKQTSLGHVLTTLFDPAASSFAMTAAQ
ncbi:hypothetical protein EDB81DRAFT_916011 [Dactylonectria macrodidyma]|uniref:Uncharacterized protein n=1 Tax=Dactylonectria macrodidyma TaxID=307937 RepID=A0A9P9IFC6_9HYPO|nr:hypothetical protein EDB81DRAFT_916011 [Dactylonectria macrodidyma]